MRIFVVAMLAAGCSGAPLPNDFERAQAREAARDDEGARLAYRTVREECQRTGIQRKHDDCALAAVREATLEERLERWPEAYAVWRMVPPLTSDGRKASRALVRAAEIAADRLADEDTAEKLAWSVVDQWPDEVPADDALKLGIKIGKKRDPARLAQRLDELFARYQKLDLGDNLLFARAELSATSGDEEAAIAAWDRLAARYPRSGLFDDSLWRAAEILRRQGDFRGAILRLQKILDTHKDALVTGSYNSLVLDDAQLLVGQIWLDDLKKPEEAAVAFQNLVDDFKDSRLRDDGLHELARAKLARHSPSTDGDKREACAALAQLFARFPTGNMVRRGRQLASEIGCDRIPSR